MNAPEFFASAVVICLLCRIVKLLVELKRNFAAASDARLHESGALYPVFSREEIHRARESVISSSKRAADAQDEFTFARDEVKKGKPITLAELQKAAKDEIKARYSHQWDWARFCSMVEGNIRVLHGATIAEVRAKHLKDSLDLSFMENEAADIALLQTALANTYAEGK